MTHKGRMRRGKENVDKGILPNNEDTLYYLENKDKKKSKKESKKEKSKKGKE
jgi:hypothetical protein